MAAVCTDHVLVRAASSGTKALVKSQLHAAKAAVETGSSSRSLTRHGSRHGNAQRAEKGAVDDGAAVMRAVGVPGVGKEWLATGWPAAMEEAAASVAQERAQQQLAEDEARVLTPVRRAAMVSQSMVALARAASLRVPVTVLVLGGDIGSAHTVRVPGVPGPEVAAHGG